MKQLNAMEKIEELEVSNKYSKYAIFALLVYSVFFTALVLNSIDNLWSAII